MTTRWTISQIMAANKRNGYHFFEPGAMRFFNSHVMRYVYNGKGGVYFITSEQFDWNSPRLYTIRQFHPETGNVDTASEFQEFRTLEDARTRTKELARAVLEQHTEVM
jgi:hypothetical protein